MTVSNEEQQNLPWQDLDLQSMQVDCVAVRPFAEYDGFYARIPLAV